MSSLDVRAIDEKDLRHQPCPSVRQEYRVFLSEDAFDRAVARGEGDTTREIGGVLVGELLRDDHGPYLKIEETIDALHAEEKGAELTFTHATWEHIHKEMDSRHKGKRVVGWYHTHPGFGVFLSDRDQFIHKSFFDLPFQVAFVYDPKSKEHGLFAWKDGEVVRARRYWVGPREQVWDGPRTAGKPADKEAAEKARAREREDARDRERAAAVEVREEGPPGLVSFIAIALVLALLAGFVGHWLGSRAAAEQALLHTQLAILKGKEEGHQLAMESLEHQLIAALRTTLGEDVVRKPVDRAIADLDRAIAALRPATPAPAAPAPGAGSATPPAAPAAPAPGAGSAAAPAAPAPAPAPAPASSTNVEQALGVLQGVRANLARLRDERVVVDAALAQLQQATRRGGMSLADLTRDVAQQRAGLGALYAELAADVARAGNPARAKALLAAAAVIDPANRPRYEKQLQTFDKSGALPHGTEDGAGAGSAKPGDKR